MSDSLFKRLEDNCRCEPYGMSECSNCEVVRVLKQQASEIDHLKAENAELKKDHHIVQMNADRVVFLIDDKRYVFLREQTDESS